MTSNRRAGAASLAGAATAALLAAGLSVPTVQAATGAPQSLAARPAAGRRHDRDGHQGAGPRRRRRDARRHRRLDLGDRGRRRDDIAAEARLRGRRQRRAQGPDAERAARRRRREVGRGAAHRRRGQDRHRSGRSQYSGTVSIQTSGAAPSFSLVDPTHGGATTDLRAATTGTGTTFTDADNVWGSGTTADRATAGVDATYGAQTTYNFYSTFLGRQGIFNNGTGVRSRVHYGNAYVNAFWDGTQMTYGDGASNARPLTELDVAGHEMSHGVTENTANLVYSGESGGLNEATSDIFGTGVEWFAQNASDPG